jgi:hypothetical protein
MNYIAATNVTPLQGQPGGGPAELSGLEAIFGNLVSSLLALAGIVLFIFIVFGGIKYITSGGDPKAVDAAKKTITYAIGGVALIAVSYLILVLLGTITGVDLGSFSITR